MRIKETFFLLVWLTAMSGCGGNVKGEDGNEDSTEDTTSPEQDSTTDPDAVAEDAADDVPVDDVAMDEPIDISDPVDPSTEDGQDAMDVEDSVDGEDGEELWIDNDSDGHPSWDDCNDDDPEVIPGSIQSCQSACDYGTQTCVSGSWTPCSAGSDCACTTPGETQMIDCGKCGQASRTCTSSGEWTAPTACFGEGECFAGGMDDERCSFCGLRSRFCDSSCHWMDWTECDHPGECTPGTERYDYGDCDMGYIKPYLCNSDCTWEESGACSSDCPGTPRTGGYDEEVCIPGGPFLMGCSDPTICPLDELPQHTVTLSPFYIDKYEVTNARYRACVEAGVCASPWEVVTTSYYFTDADNWAVAGISWNDARIFCEWDGGRALPTEAQWEKAAKGPSPNDPIYTWGDTLPTCSEYPASGCPGECHRIPDLVDMYMVDVSYYGVFGLSHNAIEFTMDFYQSDYYSISPDLDPSGPSSGALYTVRSFAKCYSPEDMRLTARGSGNNPDYRPFYTSFRCARSAID